MSFFIAILGLAFLILIHEAGHFFTAIALRMRPRSFNLGFGPALAKMRHNDVDYAIRVVPLGGYVKIPGMNRPAPSDVDVQFGAAIRDAPVLVGRSERLKRALAADDHEQARRELDAFSAAAASAGVSVDRGIQELGDALGPEAYWKQPTWKRISVILAGPATNFVFAILLFAIVLMSVGGKVTTRVEETFEGRPAAQAGLRPGDRILTIDGVRVGPEQITERISGSGGKPLILVVRRDGGTVVVGPVRPKLDEGVYRLGFRLGAAPLGTGESFEEAVVLTGRLTREIGRSLGNIVNKEGREQIASPIGIIDESQKAADRSWEEYVALLAFISLSLALLNMLPLLPLDGGHIVFALAEGIRGRAVRREIYERVSAVGIALVLLLFFVGLSNDVGRLGGG
jgi:regulator of sigma E protease